MGGGGGWGGQREKERNSEGGRINVLNIYPRNIYPVCNTEA